MNIEYIIQLWKEDDAYVAYCPQIDISSCGDSIDNAKKNLFEAIDLFIEEAKNQGSLDDILNECGYRKTNNQWQSPYFVGIERNNAKI